jgi:putative ABC transport system permease protein
MKWFWKQRSEAAEEIQSHIAERADELVESGVPPDEALQQARREFGNATLISESSREVWGWTWLDHLGQDLRYAARMLRRSPAFTAVAVLSLVLGIGANTVLFSIVNGVLLKPLPYRQPDRLARMVRSATETDVTMPEFQFWKEHSTVFDSVAASRGIVDRTLIIDGASQPLFTELITTDFFRTLGVGLALGREFTSEETLPHGPDAVILTHGVWQQSFAADPAIIGRRIMLSDTVHTVVGVLPSGFWFPESVDAFVPLRVSGTATDTGNNSQMIGRLKEGVSFRQAGTATTALRRQFREAGTLPYELPPDYPGLMPIPYPQWLTGDVRAILLILFGAVGVLLLVACSNLASMFLARLAVREKEIALRLALGSSRSRIIRQFLTENVLLSAAGALAALVCAASLLPGLLAWIPFRLPAAAPIRIDAPVLLFTLAVGFFAAILLSLAPCLVSGGFDIHRSLKTGARSSGTTATKQRARSVLVVCQVALSVILLVAAVLLSQSLYRITHQELGFAPHGLITFRVAWPEGNRGGSTDSRPFEDALLERLSSLHGIRNVAAVNVLPLRGPNNFPTQRAGHPEQSVGGMEIRVVTPSYFETMGIPLRRGRPFTADDDTGGPPVIMVSERLARAWWGTENPLGDHVVIGLFRGRVVPEGGVADSPREVVGIVGDTKGVFIKAPPRPTVYIPAAQASAAGRSLIWLVRGPSNGSAEDFQKAVQDVDPRRRIEGLTTMDEIVGSSTRDSRFNAALFDSFAALAVLLAAIGVFGLLSFSVTQRTHELGTRIALGASRRSVLAMIFKQGFILVGTGLVLGIAAALALSRFLSTLLFGVRPLDAFSYVAAAVLLLCIGIFAAYLPARHAANVDPMIALRSD